jgi:hypothetical protein
VGPLRLIPPWVGWLTAFIGWLIAAFLGWLLLGQHEENGRLSVIIDSQQQETQEAVEANEGCILALLELQETNTGLIDERRANAVQREQELSQRNRDLVAANLRADEERRKRDEIIRQTASCSAYATHVVADRCPDIARGLRERSSRARSHEADSSH